MNKLLIKKQSAKQAANRNLLTATKLPGAELERKPEETSMMGVKGFLNLISQFVAVGGDFA